MIKDNFISHTEAGLGLALLLIHPFPTDQRLWEQQRVGLQKYFRVITLDLLGFGLAQPTDGKAVTMENYADQVKALLDQLQIKKAIIGGESLGGYIALAFLQKYPDRVNGLVLSNTQSIADTPEAKEKREATAIEVLEQGTSKFITNLLPKLLSPTATVAQQNSLKKIVESQHPNAIASALRGMAQRSDTSNILANSTLPVLVITSDQDSLVSPEQSQQMHALAKKSQLITVADAGHLSSFEQPEQWNAAVESWGSTIIREKNVDGLFPV